MSGEQPEVVRTERYNYGRLWADGTFEKLGFDKEGYARQQFEEKEYELQSVPESLRPVFGRRKSIITTEIYPAEPCPEKDA